MTFDATRLADYAKRQEAEKLFLASRAADEAYDNASADQGCQEAEAALDEKYQPQIDAIETADDEARAAVMAKYESQLDALKEQIDTLENQRAGELNGLNKDRIAKRRALDARRDQEGPLAALRAAKTAADTAYQDYDAPAISLNYDDEIEHCALSGVILFEGDDIFENPNDSDEKILRAAAELVGLAPRKDDEHEDTEKAA